MLFQFSPNNNKEGNNPNLSAHNLGELSLNEDDRFVYSSYDVRNMGGGNSIFSH